MGLDLCRREVGEAETDRGDTITEAERKRFEDATLLALRMEKGGHEP